MVTRCMARQRPIGFGNEVDGIRGRALPGKAGRGKARQGKARNRRFLETRPTVLTDKA